MESANKRDIKLAKKLIFDANEDKELGNKIEQFIKNKYGEEDEAIAVFSINNNSTELYETYDKIKVSRFIEAYSQYKTIEE